MEHSSLQAHTGLLGVFEPQQAYEVFESVLFGAWVPHLLFMSMRYHLRDRDKLS